VALVFGYCVLSMGLNSLVALSEVRRSIRMSDTVTSLHSSFFGWALVGLSLAHRSFAGISRSKVYIAAIGAVGFGALIFATAQTVWMSLFGAISFGIGAAGIVVLIPGLVASVFPESRGITLGKLNVAPTAAGLVLPAALAFGLWWRLSISLFMAAITIIALITFLPVLRVKAFDHQTTDADEFSLLDLMKIAPFRRRFLIQVVQISGEFAFGIWTVVFLREVGGLSAQLAPLAAVMWATGMSVSRLSTALFVRFFGRWLELAGFSLVALASGSLLLLNHPAAMLLSIALTAVGFGPMYSLGVDRMYIAAHAVGVHDDRSISAAAGLASGLGVVLGPLAVGVASDLFALRGAMGYTPAVGVVCTVLALVRWKGEVGRLGQSEP
jgi:predicted MFS family arabinose efflux permease